MNTILKIFDNIGFKFKVENDKFIPYKNIQAFSLLDQSHIGYSIPYLARNISSDSWEVGVGSVVHTEDGKVGVERSQIVKSSADNLAVSFTDPDKCEFYLFANQNNFDTGFANTIVVDKSITAYNFQATYLVDSTSQTVDIILPQQPLDNLSIDIKLIGGDNNVNIREYDGHVLDVLNHEHSYNRVIYKNNLWYILYSSPVNSFSSLSESPTFSALANPGGNPYSFQYNDGANGLLGGQFYLGSSGNSLLLGSDSTSLAHTILAVSGSGTTTFNNDRQSSDFIVYGSGTKNLFFTYDGRLGINIPSGSRPATIFHVVNTICQEGFRLENRNTCHPANMTLYHKPNGSLVNNTKVSQINLSAKNSDGNKTDYAKIDAYSLNTSSSSEKGHLDLVVRSGSNDIKAFSADPDNILVGYSGINNLQINRTGFTTIGYSNSKIGISSSTIAASSTSLTFNGTSVSLQANNITIGSGGSSITAQGIANIGTIQSSNINMQNISPSSIISVNNNSYLTAISGVTTNAYNTINFSAIPSGKFLTTIENGTVTGIFNLNDYFYTDQDILWNKYSKRSATICLRQVTFDETVPLVEFSVGDQIAIESNAGTQYRFIEELDISSNQIAGLLLDQNVTLVTISNFKIYSITRGGYLSISRYVDPGTVGDNSDIILSIRPETATEFNTSQKNIDFIVHGSEQQPALYIKSHTNQPIVQSGSYHLFATRENNIFPMIVTTGGVGLNNEFSSANFGRDITSNLFSGILSDVGSNGKSSYYGTYDQNGNVAEWVEKNNLIDMTDIKEMAVGGSIKTSGNTISSTGNISTTGLRSFELLDRSGCYDYVGFRISAVYNMSDYSNISASTGLNMSFVSIIDSENISDESMFYEAKPQNSYELASIPSLGSVDGFYRIGKYEITNNQYVKFLKAVATTYDRGLYDSRMSSDNSGGILQIGSSPNYDYSVKNNMGDKPVNFVNFISSIRFINWLHNGVSWDVDESSVDVTIDTGAYNIIPNGTNSYLVSKNRYRKYWLPSLNQWHKSAYFEPIVTAGASGVSAIMVRRSEPHTVIADDISATYASVSVSGWLYVDHLIVGDNVNVSSPIPRRDIDDGDTGDHLACTTNADCLFCEVCSDAGFCTRSTDECCVDNCCLSWDNITGICSNCAGCFGDDGSGNDSSIPCPPFCQ
jgi:hypothetical protein